MKESVPRRQDETIQGMNSKERVLAAVDHVEPDRVPVDLWALPPVTDKRWVCEKEFSKTSSYQLTGSSRGITSALASI